LWPGGPVVAHFSARYGPDNRLLQTFVLRVENSAGLPAMLDEGVKRMDQVYSLALSTGQLRPDSSLVIEAPVDPETLTEEVPTETTTPGDVPTLEIEPSAIAPAATVSTFTVQFDTPDVSSVSSIESSVRGVPGVKSASTSSLALGGVSVMRVSFEGDLDTLKVALSARGFSVKEGGGTLRISRGGQ
jgi:hypothetical protein